MLFAGLVPFMAFSQSRNEENKTGGNTATVLVSFIVEIDGAVTNVSVMETKCSFCSRQMLRDYEKKALETVRKSPKMKPQEKPTKYSIPIRFVP